MTEKLSKSLEILNIEKIYPQKDCATLNDFKLNGIYTIGLASSPKYITVVSQQRRSIAFAKSLLNILEAKKFSNEIKIAVIGGGISGITLSQSIYYLSKEKLIPNLDIKIFLFESATSYCIFQKNCHIRRLHPNVHKWPLENWDTKKVVHKFPNVCLDWESDTASQVAKSLVNNFYKTYEPQRGDNQSLYAYKDCDLTPKNWTIQNLTLC